MGEKEKVWAKRLRVIDGYAVSLAAGAAEK
jgi:hypothetical protein